MGRIGSGIRVRPNASFQKKNSPTRGSVSVKTAPRGSDRVRTTGRLASASFPIDPVYFVKFSHYDAFFTIAERNYRIRPFSSSSRMRFMSHNWSAMHETASSYAECSRDKPPFSFVRGQDSTM